MAKKKNPQLEIERRQQILMATYKLLSTRSFHKVTLCHVAKEAKMSSALVFYYFKNKENLALETLRFFIHLQSEKFLSIARDTEKSIQERVKQVVEVAFPSREDVEHKASFLNEVWAMAKEHPRALVATREFYGYTREFCQTLLAIGRQEGYVKRDDPEWMTLFLNALIDGLVLQIAFNPKLNVEEIREKLLKFFDDYLKNVH